MNRPLKGISFTPMAIGMTSIDMVPSTIIQMCVAVEDILAFELALDELKWQIHMGIERHRVSVSKLPKQRPRGGAPVGPKGLSLSARLGGGAEADEYAKEEAIDDALAQQFINEDMEMDMDTDKNNGTDKDAKDGAQERRAEEN